ncbi:hypothetical protein FB567DRAFT_156404 [Paraphoma chrysanthemicola]|uniref:Uncharacterized protein n=1 Tax=Paraphoma chrysanthemicola TaxID=798071 RepID=A0A8K0QX34_9PLEO|nr:hypothetical protein FB567DRAFT_156404 [Paraphoma chrysanthemicola]
MTCRDSLRGSALTKKADLTDAAMITDHITEVQEIVLATSRAVVDCEENTPLRKETLNALRVHNVTAYFSWLCKPSRSDSGKAVSKLRVQPNYVVAAQRARDTGTPPRSSADHHETCSRGNASSDPMTSPHLQMLPFPVQLPLLQITKLQESEEYHKHYTLPCYNSTSLPRPRATPTSTNGSRHRRPQTRKRAPFATATGMPTRSPLSAHTATTPSIASALSHGSARRTSIAPTHVRAVSPCASPKSSTRKRRD